MCPDWEIHNYQKRYKKALEALERAKISEHNKQLIKAFDQACLVVEKLKLASRIKIIERLKQIAEILGKDFDQASEEDLKRVIYQLENRPNSKGREYSIWSKQTFRTVLKKFYKYLIYVVMILFLAKIYPSIPQLSHLIKKQADYFFYFPIFQQVAP